MVAVKRVRARPLTAGDDKTSDGGHVELSGASAAPRLESLFLVEVQPACISYVGQLQRLHG